MNIAKNHLYCLRLKEKLHQGGSKIEAITPDAARRWGRQGEKE